MKALFEYTPREEWARVKVEKGTKLLGDDLFIISYLGGASLIDRLRSFDSQFPFLLVHLSFPGMYTEKPMEVWGKTTILFY